MIVAVPLALCLLVIICREKKNCCLRASYEGKKAPFYTHDNAVLKMVKIHSIHGYPFVPGLLSCRKYTPAATILNGKRYDN